MIAFAEGLIAFVQGYVALGGAFGVVFVVFGVQRVDPAAQGASPLFRLLILPGVALLWPWWVVRWARGTPPPAERNAHRAAAERNAHRTAAERGR